MGTFIKRLLVDILIAGVLAGGVLLFIQPTVVRQSSMENSFHNGDYLLVARQAYRTITPERGDVVVFKSDTPVEKKLLSPYDRQILIKRVIGLPGDEISIIDNAICVNGTKLNETYVKGLTGAVEYPKQDETIKVPEGMYYLLGDNRENSLDSRTFGFIEKERIIGKVFVRLFPDAKLVP